MTTTNTNEETSDSFVVGMVECNTMLDDEGDIKLDAGIKLMEDLKLNAEEEGLHVFDLIMVAVPPGRGHSSMKDIGGILRQDIGVPSGES